MTGFVATAWPPSKRRHQNFRLSCSISCAQRCLLWRTRSQDEIATSSRGSRQWCSAGSSSATAKAARKEQLPGLAGWRRKECLRQLRYKCVTHIRICRCGMRTTSILMRLTKPAIFFVFLTARCVCNPFNSSLGHGIWRNTTGSLNHQLLEEAWQTLTSTI